MAGMQDFYSGEDLDAILTAIDDDLLEESEELSHEIDAIVAEVSEIQPNAEYLCDLCPKVYKTKHGLTRHKQVKHANESQSSSAEIEEYLLHPLKFKTYVTQSALKLSKDECYSEKTRKQFCEFTMNVEEANFSYQYVHDVISNFKGDSEKFFPLFYKSVSEDIVFKHLSRKASVILGFEVANYVLGHLTGSIVTPSSTQNDPSAKKFSSKEQSIIRYLSGYVFGTFFRRITRAKHSVFGEGCLEILLAGKLSCEEPKDSDLLINAKNRGGLWNVTEDVYEIFTVVESCLQQSFTTVGRHIDSKAIVSDVLKNGSILYNLNKIRGLASCEVSKEVSLNLLEHLIMLYVRVRVFSTVKDKIEIHKIQSKKKNRNHFVQKSRSLPAVLSKDTENSL